MKFKIFYLCAVFALTTSSIAQVPQAQANAFPVIGTTYLVIVPGDAFHFGNNMANSARVKVLSAGNDSWFRVEYQNPLRTSNTQEPEKFQLWLNFATAISAEETTAK